MNNNFSNSKGWIRSFRVWQNTPIINKDAFHFALWQHLNLMASHQEREVEFDGNMYTLKPGELITGRKSLSIITKIDESKIQRILKRFERSGLIYQKTTNRNRLIGIIFGEKDKQTEHPFEQHKMIPNKSNQIRSSDSRLMNEHQTVQNMVENRTTNEQQVNTNKNDNNEIMEEVVTENQPLHQQTINLFELWGQKPDKGQMFLCANLIKQHGLEIVTEAFLISSKRSSNTDDKRNLGYVEAIVQNENRQNNNIREQRRIGE